MNAGLKYLYWKETVGGFRLLARRLSGVRAIIVILGIGILIGPHLFQLIVSTPDAEAVAGRFETIRFWGPPVLLLSLFVFGVSTTVLYFKPAEIDFLFPAPVSRRQLVAYNVLSRLRTQVFSSLWCSIFFVSWSASWLSAFVGCLFLLTLLQLSAQLSGLFLSTVSETLGKTLRRCCWILLGLVILGVLLSVRPSREDVSGILGSARAFVGHPAMRTASIVTHPFVEVFLADSFLAILKQAGVCSAILALELALLMVIDVAFAERSIATSQKVQSRLQRMRSEGGAITSAAPTSTRLRVPSLPRLGGAGVIAWRQGLEIVRHLKSLVFLFLFGCLPVAPFLIVSRSGADSPDGVSAGVPQETVIPLLILVTVFFTQNATFDFRRDLDRMVTLKSLPLKSSAIAAGQILPLTLVVTLVQYIALLIVCYIQGGLEPWLVGTLFLGLPAVNWVVVAVDNAVFLFFPHRINPNDAGNVPFVGRMMMTMLLKMLIVFVVGGIGGGLVAFAWWLSDESFVIAGATLTIYLAMISAPATWVVAIAFDRFEVTRSV